jgi:hypothetical protein
MLLNQNFETMQRNHAEVVEQKYVLEKSRQFFSQAHALGPRDTGGDIEMQALRKDDAKNRLK